MRRKKKKQRQHTQRVNTQKMKRYTVMFECVHKECDQLRCATIFAETDTIEAAWRAYKICLDRMEEQLFTRVDGVLRVAFDVAILDHFNKSVYCSLRQFHEQGVPYPEPEPMWNPRYTVDVQDQDNPDAWYEWYATDDADDAKKMVIDFVYNFSDRLSLNGVPMSLDIVINDRHTGEVHSSLQAMKRDDAGKWLK